MRVRIKDISDSGVVLDIPWEEKELSPLLPHQDPSKIGLPHPVRVHMEIYRHGDHIRITGSLEGHLRLLCDRCLQPVERRLEERIDVLLADQKYAPTREEIELGEEDLNYEFFDGEVIDIDRLIAEQIFLNLPLKVLCSPSCRGLCPICGTNLNYQDCGCAHAGKGSSFAVLEGLKADPRTQNIPVIVVSAKDITEAEWQRLHGQIEGLYQKGSLPPMEFVDQVVEVIEQKSTKGDAE